MALAPRFDDADFILPAGVSEAVASPRESLMVLTRDGQLLGTLRNVATGHVIVAVDAEPELAGLLIHNHGGVALIDTAAVASPIAQLTQRLKQQFPDLILVVAGDAQDQAALGPQITNGMVYRFLHKPVSEQRVRLFVAAAWRRHGEETAGMAALSATRTTRILPVRRSRKGLWIAMLIAAGVASVVAWFAVRAPQPTPSVVPSQGAIARQAPPPSIPPADPAPMDLESQIAQFPVSIDALDATVERSAALNALPVYESADVGEPAPVAADTVQAPAADRILGDARDALTAGRLEEGERLIQLAAESGAAPEQLDELVGRARDLRISTHANEMSRLVQRFNERIAQGKLVEPETDSAKFYLGELARAESGHPSTKFARDTLSTRLVTEGRAAMARKEIPAARRWLAQAEESGADAQSTAVLKQEIAAADRPAAKTEELVAATSLTKLHNVNPEYPSAARNRGTEGWVELTMTVEPDGSVGAIAVTHAEPAMVFDAVAIDAVRQWRYEPVKRDGTAVAQRTKVRIRFELK